MKTTISVDTDGLYVNKKVDVEELNIFLDDFTKETFNLNNYLHLDMDTYDAAFFRATKGKQYILKEGDKLTFHGVSFKGSKLPKFWDQILEEIARDMFNGNVKRKKFDINKYTIAELAQSIKVKDESEYKTKTSLSMQLIQQAKKEFKHIKLMDGDQLSYVKCRYGYELVVPGKTYDIDYRYYEDIINKVYERLDIEDSRQVRFI